MIMTTLGGMREPKVPPAARQPVATVSLYLYFLISGKATVVIARAVAITPDGVAKKDAMKSAARFLAEAVQNTIKDFNFSSS